MTAKRTTTAVTWANELPTIHALLGQPLTDDQARIGRCYPVRERGAAAVAELEARAGHVEVRQAEWAIVRVGNRRVLVLLNG
jgi:hypothetical protein